MDGANAPMTMGGASSASNNPEMNNNAPMENGMDDNSMGGLSDTPSISNASSSMDGASGEPMNGAENEPPMDMGAEGPDNEPTGMDDDMPMDNENGSEEDDSTMSIINQLSDTDREAVRAYAESMLNRDESQNDEDDDKVPPMDASMGQDQSSSPMMETIIFTKGQLRKINENFGPTADELEKDNKPIEKKKSKQVSSKSPFNSPKFK